MARVIYVRGALRDLQRLVQFLLESDTHLAAETAPLIASAIEVLLQHPYMGRPVEQGLRELVISRGRTGYIALYTYDEAVDVVRILALRHQREAGYSDPE